MDQGVDVKARKNRDVVSFITTQQGDDLMVSFAIADEEPGEVVTLVLLRTRKYEALLPDEERGVTVSHEADFDDEGNYLRRISLAGSVITIESTRRRYELEVSQVDGHELKAARRVLAQMNFDGRFVLEL
jgi:hypothetical protein